MVVIAVASVLKIASTVIIIALLLLLDFHSYFLSDFKALVVPQGVPEEGPLFVCTSCRISCIDGHY